MDLSPTRFLHKKSQRAGFSSISCFHKRLNVQENSIPASPVKRLPEDSMPASPIKRLSVPEDFKRLKVQEKFVPANLVKRLVVQEDSIHRETCFQGNFSPNSNFSAVDERDEGAGCHDP